MIDIEQYIKESKYKENISNGGSPCYDFGDYVLIKYSCPLGYLKEGYRVRKNEENVLEGIKEKVRLGVNVPRHITYKRLIEDNNDICYVLQEKCRGINCIKMSKFNASFKEVMDSMESIFHIPFDHIKKLIKDGCSLYEMGYEPSARNLFYDNKTGFWYIDLTDNDFNNRFDSNDITKVFRVLKYKIPNLIDLVSSMKYGTILDIKQKILMDNMTNLVKAKYLLAIESVLPIIKKYEKFYLIAEEDNYKDFLIEKGIVDLNLYRMDSKDYLIFNELYELVLNSIVEDIINGKKDYWEVRYSEISNKSNLFNLKYMWLYHKNKKVMEQDYENDYDYEFAAYEEYDNMMMDDIIKRLKNTNITDASKEFIDNCIKSNSNNLQRVKKYKG